MFYSDFGVKVRMKSDTVRTHFTFGLIVNGDIFQTNILTFMILKIFICFYLWVYIYVLACLYIYSVNACSAHRDQKQASNPLKLE